MTETPRSDNPPACPKCGGDGLDRVEVDIGVGIQCGPWQCFDCGWSQDEDADAMLAALTKLTEAANG